MRVVSCSSFGPLEQLTIEERPSAPLGAGDVRIAVTASGVNFVDGLFVQGLYQVKPPLPFVPGGEVAGVIAEVGSDVTTHTVGQRVFASTGLNGFASEVVVPARMATPTPDVLSDGQAATFVQSYMTAWFALRQRAGAKPGQRLLVLGAGGGVGLAAVDVGRSMGLRVLAGASSDDKRALATAAGAEAVVDTTAGDLKDRAREWGGGGVDIVYDPVGGDLAEPALRALDAEGQYLVVGFAAGQIPKLPANLVLLRNRNLVGVDWGGWIGAHQAENQQLMADMLAAVTAGELHPVEPTAYAFERAADALRDQLERRVTGKSVLTL